MSAWGGGQSSFKSCNSLLKRIEDNDPALCEVTILPMKTFGDVELDRLSAACKKNTKLWSISASGHYVSSKSLSNLGYAISSRSSISNSNAEEYNRCGGIRYLSIGNKDMGDDGCCALINGLGGDCRRAEDEQQGSENNNSSKINDVTKKRILPLESLDLEYKGISRISMISIGKVLFGRSSDNTSSKICSRIQHLNLSRNSKIGDDGIEGFYENSCCQNNCGSDANNAVDDNPFNYLKSLNFSECSITHEGIDPLCKCLERIKREKDTEGRKDNDCHDYLTLTLNSNPIGFDGCHLISTKLLQSHDRSPSSAIITTLNLSNCSIGDEGVSLLIGGLTVTSSTGAYGLRALDISYNNIGLKGAKKIAESLSISDGTNTCWPNLIDLSLAGNVNIGEEGVVSICNSLSQSKPNNDYDEGNRILLSIDVSQTTCGTNGVAAAMRCNYLKSLRLFNNKLGKNEKFGMEIAPYLYGGHKSLVNLDLGGNDICSKCIIDILESIMMKTTTDKRKEEEEDKQQIYSDVSSKSSTLETLEIGGNEASYEIENLITKLKHIQPNLDIARDRPQKK